MKILRLVAVLAYLVAAHAVYEDQLGTTDWQKQFVGQVLHAHLHKSKPRLFLGTQEGVVGSLNLRDGGIAWRRLLATDEAVDGVVLFDKPSVVVTLSHHGKYLRAWDQTEGVIRWEVSTYPSSSPIPSNAKLLSIALPSSSSSAVAVIINGYVQLHDVTEGQLKWKTKLPAAADTSSVTLAVSQTHIIAVSAVKGNRKVSLGLINPMDGSMQTELLPELPSGMLIGSIVATSDNVAVLTSDHQHICTVTGRRVCHSLPLEATPYVAGWAAGGFTGGEPDGFKCHAISAVAAGIAPAASLRLLAAGPSVILSAQNTDVPGVALLQFNQAGDVSISKVFPAAGLVTAAIPIEDDIAVGLLEARGATGLTLVVLSASSGELLHEETAVSLGAEAGQAARPRVVQAFLGTFKKRDQSDGFRVLLTWSDAALMLVQQGQVVWGREEALASVTAVHFAELPAVQHAAAALIAQQPNNTFNDHVKLQLLSIKVQFKMDTPEEVAELADLRQRLSAKNRPFRDTNGFRKLIIVLTRVGKLLALHTGDGRTMWALNLPPLPAGASVKLLPWRTFHDIEHAPQLLVLAHGAASTVGYVVSTHSGALVETLEVPFAAAKVSPMHRHLHDGKAEQEIIMLISAGPSPSVRLMPNTPAARESFAAQLTALSFWTHDTASNCLVGYGFTAGALDAASGIATPVETWRMRFGPGEDVLALAVRDHAEPIHSYVKILGNRSLLYKYLNPNTLFVASGPSEGALVPDGPGRRITAALVDTVTGRVIHRQTHMGACGPVQAVFAENWVVYQYFSAVSSRFEVVVSEMYDAKHRPFSMMDAMFGDSVSHETLSSMEPSEVDVMTQIYYSKLPARALGVTASAKGLTPKDVLFVTQSDQVYAIPKRVLDPRRPRTARLTREEAEEGLMPYQEELGVHAPLFATLNKQVGKARSVATAPAGLESATHMLALGVDLFYHRLQPAKAFDSLEDDFSYGLLLLALVALVVSSFVLHYTSAKSQLAQKWK